MFSGFAPGWTVLAVVKSNIVKALRAPGRSSIA
jgi:hypothetical protein